MSMRETKGPFTAFGADPPYVLKNSLCEVVLHIENLLLRERKCHGIDMASFGKKKPQPTFILSMKFLSLDGGVSSRSSLSLQQKGNAFIRTNY